MSKENRSSHAAKRGPMGHRGPGAPTEKAKNFKGTMKQLIAYMRPYYLNIIVSMLFAVLSQVFMVVDQRFWEGRQLSWSADLPLKYMGQDPSISTVSQKFCYF